MSIQSYIRQIGRGSKGSSHLSREDAKFVFSDQIPDIELGAFCIAMRMKGETAHELAGFMDAVQMHIKSLDTHGQKTILLPSYNGSRKQMNLTPVLAKCLQDLGFLVIVQGVQTSPGRITTYDIFKELGWPILDKDANWDDLIQSQAPIFVPLESICAPLQRLLRVREQLGLRNSGHVLAKLIMPVTGFAWQIVNYTHPEYPLILDEYLGLYAANVILMRGHEGEPTSSPTRLPEMRFFKSGSPFLTSSEYRFERQDDAIDLGLKEHVDFVQAILTDTAPMPEYVRQQALLIHQNCL
jgi:anthranilate phosphoribosyltransferase